MTKATKKTKKIKDMSIEEIAKEIEDTVGDTDEALKNNEDFLDGLRLEDDMTQEASDTDVPTKTSPEWNDYVLSLLTDAEKVPSGAPKTDGVRRLTELLVGEIIGITTDVIHATIDSAVVKTTITIDTGSSVMSFDGVADAHGNNTDDIFAQYMVAMAETRSYGRALKKALCIRTTVAEETSKKASEVVPSRDELRTEGPITGNQITFIGYMCDKKRSNINVQNLVNKIAPDVDNINKLTHEQALEVNSLLAEYQDGKKTVPESIGKYDPAWVEVFGGK